MNLQDVKEKDIVVRMLAGFPMKLKVTKVTDTTIECGPWTFSRKTGGEIDEDLGWDGFTTGSIISPLPKE